MKIATRNTRYLFTMIEVQITAMDLLLNCVSGRSLTIGIRSSGSCHSTLLDLGFLSFKQATAARFGETSSLAKTAYPLARVL